LCVAAARAAISLLNYHDNDHPFSMWAFSFQEFIHLMFG
jgi:hypothetical protein